MDTTGTADRQLNDLAATALRGLAVARRRIRQGPMLALGAAGFAVSAVAVVAGGRVGPSRSTRALSTWLGLEDRHRTDAADRVPAAVLLAAIAVLLVLWIVALGVVRRTRQPERRVWWLVAAWSAPFALGPPLMDTGVYTSAAFGLIQRAGHDPYTNAPSSLGGVRVVASIDPGARGIPSSAGPLGSVVQHLAVAMGGGSATAAVVVLRVLGVLAAVAIGRLAAELAGRRSAEALATSALNPLVLLYVISSPHPDGLTAALALAALVAATRRRWRTAIALAAVAGSISGPGFVLVPVLVVAHALSRRGGPVRRLVAGDLAVAGAVTTAAGLLQPHGFGWLWTVSRQFTVHTPYAIASATGQLLAPIVPGASFDDLAASGRLTAMTAAACTIGYLLVTARHRALERTAGYSLLAIGLLAPVLYPWYLLWGVVCVTPTATGTRRVWVVAASAGGCVLMPVGFTGHTADVITGVALALVGAATAVALWFEHRRTVAVPGPVGPTRFAAVAVTLPVAELGADG